MGHQRLGKLPAYSSLPEIIKFLVDGGTPTADLVEHITDLSKNALKDAINDPVFIKAFWLLLRIPQAMAQEDAAVALKEIGLEGGGYATVADVLVDFNEALERVQRTSDKSIGDLGELARQAALSAMGKSIRENLPTLWDASAEDVRAAMKRMYSTEQFGAVAHEFMANFTGRLIHYFIDRNLHEMVGLDRVSPSIHDIKNFKSAITRHSHEAALIMRGFAKDWMGKNHFHGGMEVTEKSMRGFVSYVVTKLQAELEARKEPT